MRLPPSGVIAMFEPPPGSAAADHSPSQPQDVHNGRRPTDHRATADDPTRLLNASATGPVTPTVPPSAPAPPVADDDLPADLSPVARLVMDDAKVWRATLPSDALLAQLAQLLPGSMEDTSPQIALEVGLGLPITPTRTPVGRRKSLRLAGANPGVSGVIATGQRAFLGALAATVVVVLLATVFTALASRAGRGNVGAGVGAHATSSATVHIRTATPGDTPPPTAKTPITTLLGQPGTVYWKYHTGNILVGAPAVANNAVYLGGADANAYAFDAHSGGRLWATRLGATIDASPATGNGYVYFAPIDGYVYALRTSDGSLAWKTNINNSVDNGGSTPTTANGVVYIGSQDGNLYALDGATGAILWRYHTAGFTYGAPVEANGVLYFSDQKQLYALLTDGHTLRWAVPATGYGVVADGDTLLVSGNSASITAYRMTDGGVVWTKASAGQGAYGAYGTPTTDGASVYVAGNDGVYALDARTGAQRWFYLTGGGTFGSAVANGVVYFGSEDYSVYAIDAQTGKERWNYLTNNQVQGNVAVADGLVYAGSFDFFLYAIIA